MAGPKPVAAAMWALLLAATTLCHVSGVMAQQVDMTAIDNFRQWLDSPKSAGDTLGNGTGGTGMRVKQRFARTHLGCL